MLDQDNTSPPFEGEFKFQIQAMIKMMEIMNFVKGKMCDRLDMVKKYGKKLVQVHIMHIMFGLNQNQIMTLGSKGQGKLIMRLLRKMLMIWVMMMLIIRP